MLFFVHPMISNMIILTCGYCGCFVKLLH